jgi:hypothetical protein
MYIIIRWIFWQPGIINYKEDECHAAVKSYFSRLARPLTRHKLLARKIVKQSPNLRFLHKCEAHPTISPNYFLLIGDNLYFSRRKTAFNQI